MKTNSQHSFLFRFKFSSKQFPLPTQFRSFPLTYSTTCSTPTLPQLQFKPRMLPDASEKSKSTFPNRWYPHVSFSFTPLSTNSLNTKFHCAFSAMTVPISLSLYSGTYTARQTTMLQASISRSPVSANIRQAPLFLHTIEPQVFNYSHLYLTNVANKPRSLTKQTRPSRFSCQSFSF